MKSVLTKYRYLGYNYLSIPDGWKPLVKETFEKLDKVARPWYLPRFFLNLLHFLAFKGIFIKNRKLSFLFEKLPIKCQIMDIKEKWGELRMYISGDIWCYAIVEAAEKESRKTCEICGTTNGNPDIVDMYDCGGWMTTLCKHHADKENCKQ